VGRKQALVGSTGQFLDGGNSLISCECDKRSLSHGKIYPLGILQVALLGEQNFVPVLDTMLPSQVFILPDIGLPDDRLLAY
jgi:hypothetical protein